MRMASRPRAARSTIKCTALWCFLTRSMPLTPWPVCTPSSIPGPFIMVAMALDASSGRASAMSSDARPPTTSSGGTVPPIPLNLSRAVQNPSNPMPPVESSRPSNAAFKRRELTPPAGAFGIELSSLRPPSYIPPVDATPCSVSKVRRDSSSTPRSIPSPSRSRPRNTRRSCSCRFLCRAPALFPPDPPRLWLDV